MFGINSKKKSENSSKVDGEQRRFISELSYNVRNPLNTICGLAEVIRKNVENNGDKETTLSYVDILGDAATELQQTIDHFFDSFESGDYEKPQQEDNVTEPAGNILNNLRVLVVEDSSQRMLKLPHNCTHLTR